MLYDSIIIGAGPCGVSTAIYLKRANKKVLIIEAGMVGGQVAITSEVKNYPGFIDGSGFEFAMKLRSQLKENDIEIIRAEALELKTEHIIKQVVTTKGTFDACTIILCLGASSKKLEIEGEKVFEGRGVSYCATCDGALYKDKDVVVVGGGNNAFEETLYLKDLVKSVTLIHRRDEFRAEPELQNRVLALSKDKDSNLKIITNATIASIKGNDKVDSITICDLKSKSYFDLKVDGVFIAVGRSPSTEFVKNQVQCNEFGYIKVNQDFETNLSGVFAGGDVIEKSLRQIVTAVSDGALISVSVIKYLAKLNM